MTEIQKLEEPIEWKAVWDARLLKVKTEGTVTGEEQTEEAGAGPEAELVVLMRSVHAVEVDDGEVDAGLAADGDAELVVAVG